MWQCDSDTITLCKLSVNAIDQNCNWYVATAPSPSLPPSAYTCQTVYPWHYSCDRRHLISNTELWWMVIVTPVSSVILFSWKPGIRARISSDLIMTSWDLSLRKFHCKDHWAGGPDHRIQIYHVQCCPLVSRGRRWSFSSPCWGVYINISIGPCHLSHCLQWQTRETLGVCWLSVSPLWCGLFTFRPSTELTNILTFDTGVVPLFLVIVQINRYYIATLQ